MSAVGANNRQKSLDHRIGRWRSLDGLVARILASALSLRDRMISVSGCESILPKCAANFPHSSVFVGLATATTLDRCAKMAGNCGRAIGPRGFDFQTASNRTH